MKTKTNAGNDFSLNIPSRAETKEWQMFQLLLKWQA